MLALIPARGGSKGFPRKNVATLAGRPLIAHTIEAAKAAASVDRVVVSTDDEEIGAAARAAGAELPFTRPAALATDEAATADVIRHAVRALGLGDDDAFVLLQPTSPLRTAQDIDEAIALFQDRDADAVISVTAHEHPLAWAQLLNEDGLLLPHPSLAAEGRRQDLTVTYRPNGAIYVIRLANFLRHGQIRGPRTYGYAMPPERSVDIDTPFDLRLAACLLRDREA